MKCAICENDPTSHSFHKIHENENTIIYYTCPSKATKYYDTKGIIEHYNIELSQVTKKWMWIFDCNGFELKHLLEYEVGIGLAKLISEKYSTNLEKICIINPNWYIYSMVSIVWPFLTKQIKSIIVYDSSKYICNLESSWESDQVSTNTETGTTSCG